MRKGMIVEMHRQMSEREQQAHRRWLAGNLILSSLIAGALMTMAAVELIRPVTPTLQSAQAAQPEPTSR
jgi:hypothetical protein